MTTKANLRAMADLICLHASATRGPAELLLLDAASLMVSVAANGLEDASPDQRPARIASLETALTSLVARIRKVGGYSTPEEQDALRTAEWVLAGGVL